MLFRNLITTYGASLAGKSAPQDDPVWHLGRTEDLVSFRHYALDALQQAKVYLLDHAAAAYADTLHDTIQERSDGTEVAAMTFLGEIEPPAEIVWVEFDYRQLVAARVHRNSPVTAYERNATGSGQRGYLIDNRAADALKVMMFSCDSRGKILDPFFTLRFDRAEQVARGLMSVQPQIHRYMAHILAERGMAAEEIEGRFQVRLVDAGADLFIPYAVFAMLRSPDLGGIIPTDSVLFSPRELKTARKFGKSWISGAQKSHFTIRIGPQAAAHMQERLARLNFEQQVREERSGPIRHWVNEHERHYRSGKIVLIKGHHRGRAPGPGLPTRVMGPRLPVADFVFTQSDQSEE